MYLGQTFLGWPWGQLVDKIGILILIGLADYVNVRFRKCFQGVLRGEEFRCVNLVHRELAPRVGLIEQSHWLVKNVHFDVLIQIDVSKFPFIEVFILILNQKLVISWLEDSRKKKATYEWNKTVNPDYAQHEGGIQYKEYWLSQLGLTMLCTWGQFIHIPFVFHW